MINYRVMGVDDYRKVANFWQKHYKLSDRDSEDHIQILLEKNPDISMVAELDEEIVGTCLGVYDGRKGYIQKVAVRPDLRSQGVGKMMVEMAVENIKKVGAKEVRVDCDEEVVSFYERCGFVRYEIASLRFKV